MTELPQAEYPLEHGPGGAAVMWVAGDHVADEDVHYEPRTTPGLIPTNRSRVNP